MNRILFERGEIVDGRAEFSDARAEHVLNVLHGEVGQVLKTGELDGLVGTSAITEIRGLHRREEGSAQRGSGLLAGTVVVECSHTERAPEPWFDLILAPPRPRAMKRLLPQLAALGVGRIVLVGAEKVEKAFWGAQLLKEVVYRPLFVEGLMQCGASRVPVMRCERNFNRYLENGLDAEFGGYDRIVAHPGGGRGVRGGCALPVVIAIGPEGGWTDGELERLSAKGFRLNSLGSRILRTDTATIAVIAQLMAAKGI